MALKQPSTIIHQLILVVFSGPERFSPLWGFPSQARRSFVPSERHEQKQSEKVVANLLFEAPLFGPSSNFTL